MIAGVGDQPWVSELYIYIYKIKSRWGRLTDKINGKWQKELEQFAVVFVISPIYCASFAKWKERTRVPARFPVPKGPIRRQTKTAILMYWSSLERQFKTRMMNYRSLLGEKLSTSCLIARHLVDCPSRDCKQRILHVKNSLLQCAAQLAFRPFSRRHFWVCEISPHNSDFL